MTQFKLFFDKDKETEWLNRMSDQGWSMIHFFAGIYTFEPCEKGKYRYQIDFGNRFGSVSDDYRSFMTEAGIEILQSWGFWVILRKPADHGAFELYTDVDSQIEHYTKIRTMFKVITFMEIICLLVELFAAIRSGSPVLYGTVCLLFAIVLTFIRITFHTNDIISQLKERQTGLPASRSRNLSPYLVAGMLLNSISLITQDSLPAWLLIPIEVAALVLLLLGIYGTAQSRKSSE